MRYGQIDYEEFVRMMRYKLKNRDFRSVGNYSLNTTSTDYTDHTEIYT